MPQADQESKIFERNPVGEKVGMLSHMQTEIDAMLKDQKAHIYLEITPKFIFRILHLFLESDASKKN